MNMSMDKPISLNRAEGTRAPQVENAKMTPKKTPPEHSNQNMYMSMDKPMALNRVKRTTRPQAENAKIHEKRCSRGMGIGI